jgi:hypothetical protein
MLNSGFTNHDHYKRPEILVYYKEILFPIKISKKTGYSCLSGSFIEKKYTLNTHAPSIFKA